MLYSTPLILKRHTTEFRNVLKGYEINGMFLNAIEGFLRYSRTSLRIKGREGELFKVRVGMFHTRLFNVTAI